MAPSMGCLHSTRDFPEGIAVRNGTNRNCNLSLHKNLGFPCTAVLFKPCVPRLPGPAMPPKGKRPSDASRGGRRQRAKGSELPGVPADALALPHMGIFESWMPL